MDDKQRTKILAAILAAVLCFMYLRPKLMAPITDAKQELNRAATRLEAAEVKEMEQLLAEETISQASRTGLPPRANDAQRLYQSWITNLAEQCKFAQLDVKPGSTGNSRGAYTTVDVFVEAETDLDGLSRFLYLFKQAELMHRIGSLEIVSTGASGKPRLEVKLTAEGMSLEDSPQRSDVFARTTLPQEVTAEATELTVAEGADFPDKPPFLVQVGREMMRVSAASGNQWTVERAQEGTAASVHAVDQIVYAFPVAALRDGVAFARYETLLNASPFVKPAKPKTYSPRIASLTDKTITPGETVEMTARAEDVNIDIGAAEIAMEGAAEGMTFDPTTGKFQWPTPGDIAPKKYEVTFILTQKNNDELREEKKVGITVRIPNSDPTLEVPASAIVVIGQEFTLDVKAEDDGGPEGLKFSLDGDKPEGLAIDESNGQLSWNPAKTFEPGEYTVSVKVTDGGDPAKSASAPVKLNVTDDDALLTKFTGSVALDGDPIAWFRNIAKKSRPELRVGDRLVVAEIDAKLTEISRRHVMLEDSAGLWKVQLGDSLRQRILVKATTPPPTDDTEKKPAETSEKPSSGDAEYDKDPPKEGKEATAADEKPATAKEADAPADTPSPTPDPDNPPVDKPESDAPESAESPAESPAAPETSE